ncbi:MAG: glycosyltransferase [Actinomycetota bacterium]
MTTRRSVRHLIKGLGPGGAERLLLNQVRAERGRVRHRVTYLIAEKSHLVADLEALDADVQRLDASTLALTGRLRQLFIEEPTDIVHVHSPALAAAARMASRTIPAAHRPALVGTEHNRWPRHHRLTRLANRLTIRLEAATIAVSADVASTIRGARPGQVRTVVHGIDLAGVRQGADRAGARAELGAAVDDYVVVCVANLRREKAIDELIHAAQRAIADAPRLRFVLVGQGPLADDVDRWITEADLGDRFLALGYRTDVARILSGADAFTLSSHHEGLPVALMEAFALGLPVAATRAGGVPDAVGAAGILVAVGDVTALSEAYVRLSTEPDLHERCQTEAASRAEGFSVDRAIAEIGDIYEAVTSAGDAPRATS